MRGLVRQRPTDDRRTATLHELHVALTDRHCAYMARWLAAGMRMGLHDVQVCTVDLHGRPAERHIVIWVRENADPAYAVMPKGMRWHVVDCIHRSGLGMFNSLEAALNFIRPVLDIDVAA